MPQDLTKNLTTVNNVNIPVQHHGLLVPAALLGASIGALRSKPGMVGEGAIKGAAAGALVVYGLIALLGAGAIGTYMYIRTKYGADKAHEAIKTAAEATKSGS